MAIRVELPELGENQFVEIRDPRYLPWGVQKEITTLLSSDANDMDAHMNVAEYVAISLVKNGNVLNEDGVPFVFPLTVDNVKEVPGVVVEKVAEKFAELKGAKADRKNS